MSTAVDVLVIGAGPGGYHAAIRAAQLGKRVVCVDKREVGGVCLNTGCIPTKALLHVAEIAHAARGAAHLGLRVGDVAVDVERVRAFSREAVRANVSGVEALFRTNGVTFVRGAAELLGRGAVAVGEGERRIVYEAKDVVLATGAEPIAPPGWPLDGRVVFTSEEAIGVPEIPKRLLVVGGGVVGLELATVYRRLGAEVVVVELGATILPGVDDEIVKMLSRILEKEGIALRTATKVEDVVVRGEQATVRLGGAFAGEETFDRVLVAIGRRPVTRGLGLAAAGLSTDARGFVAVDERRRTNVAGIWAIGDVAGGPLLAHKAMREGVVAAEAIAGDRGSAYEPACVPNCIYTDPEIATAGLTEAEAIAAGHRVRVGRFPLSASGRARTMNAPPGLIKLVADEETDLVLGMHVLAPQAESLIGEGVMAIEMGATLEDIALSIHPHPTFTEAIHDAAEAAHGKAVHLANRPRRVVAA